MLNLIKIFILNLSLSCLIFAQNKPNIIVIMADDLGWGDLQCQGHPYVKTPNIDQIAKEGIKFQNFYVNSSVCSASRASLITGNYPTRTGIPWALGRSQNAEKGQRDFLSPYENTIFRRFAKIGYRTGHFGKWHLGNEKYLVPGYGVEEAKVMTVDWEYGWPSGWFFYSSHRITNAAIEFIQKEKSRPFYAQLWLEHPHHPVVPRVNQRSFYEGLTVNTNDFQGRTSEYLANVPDRDERMIRYCSVIGLIDYNVGRIINTLKELGIEDNTVLIFMSDNGPEAWWAGGVDRGGVGSTGGFRGVKRSLYEGGVRVPFLLRWPNKVEAGNIDYQSVIGGIDLVPTLLDLANEPIKQNEIDGESFKKLLFQQDWERKEPFKWEHHFSAGGGEVYESPQLAIREKQWKLYCEADGSNVKLYDIDADPQERIDVSKSQTGVTDELVNKLMAWKAQLQNRKPKIYDSPTSIAVRRGEKVIFSTRALGDPPLSYKWYINGLPITKSAVFSSVNNPDLCIDTSFLDRLYISCNPQIGVGITCRVSNKYGAVQTKPVGLTLYNRTIFAFDQWIETHTQIPVNKREPYEDFDGDGVSNLCEFYAGTRPDDKNHKITPLKLNRKNSTFYELTMLADVSTKQKNHGSFTHRYGVTDIQSSTHSMNSWELSKNFDYLGKVPVSNRHVLHRFLINTSKQESEIIRVKSK